MANTLFFPPVNSFPQFDELYVISDLHLGGPSDFQIFNSAEELRHLIDYLKNHLPGKTIALVINGDLVDFLAEEQAKYFDPAGAIGKLNRIAEDPSFKDVFAALKDFANTKNRRLIINLGNHDLELALPWVRAELLRILSGGNEAASARITFAFDGTGFPCKVGNATVLCVHGNEVDAWNLSDYEVIRRYAREIIQGRSVDDWIPNAGTQLVIDVMNDLKRRYPFIDLLKPETGAVLPILFALAPDQRNKLIALSATAGRLAWDSARRATGFLGSERNELKDQTIASENILSSGSGNFSKLRFDKDYDRQYAELLLNGTEEMFNQRINPMALVGEDRSGGTLGLTSAIRKFIQGEDVCEVLREVLSDIGNDRSFDPSAEDRTFHLLDEYVGNGFDFLIAGHTHLARALPRKKKYGWYFNSGTWVRLIKLESRLLNDAQEFKKVFEAFKNGTMKALDNSPNLVLRKLNIVVIRSDGKQTYGELREVNRNENGHIFHPVNNNYSFTKN